MRTSEPQRQNDMNFFSPEMTEKEINGISMLGLAHIGDGVYELVIRSKLCMDGHQSVGELHKLAVSYVNAPAQARAAEKIRPLLTEEELAVYRRGRNAHVNSVPQHATLGEYHAATGVEALMGWLYLLGRKDRINELFTIIIGENDAT